MNAIDMALPAGLVKNSQVAENTTVFELSMRRVPPIVPPIALGSMLATRAYLRFYRVWESFTKAGGERVGSTRSAVLPLLPNKYRPRVRCRISRVE